MAILKEAPRVLVRSLFLLAILAMPLVGCTCGGDEGVDTDPTTTLDDQSGLGDIDDVQIGGDPLGDPIGDTDTSGDEVLVDPSEMVAGQLQDVFFDFDQYDLGAEARSVLDANSRVLREYPSVNLSIEGHCDERGTVQYNLALGEKRARAARDYLVGLGVSGSRLSIVSYGKERPFAMGHSESAWSQNRRAHFVVGGGR